MSDLGRAVFLSHASQDAQTARPLSDALSAAGIEVWSSQLDLVGSDAWDQTIRRQIRHCALFVPIISAYSQAQPEGYFRLEWRLADQRTHLMGKSRVFLIPVCVDDTPEHNADVPDSFLEVPWTRLSPRDSSVGSADPVHPPTGDGVAEGGASELRAFVAEVKSILDGGGTPIGRRPSPFTPRGSKPTPRPTGPGGSGAVLPANKGRSADGRPVVPDYELLREIGKGSYGDVWLARGMTGLHRAVKVVWRDRFETAEPYERELRGLKEFAAISLKTEGQMALLHLGRNDEAGFFYSVMELADDAQSGRSFDPATYVPLTLKEWRQRKSHMPAAQVVTFGVDLATALAALHAQGLVHRDIKPSNAIVVNGKAKLADIGLVTASHEARTFIGTSGYVPPEGPGSPAADVFALGRVLYELATGLDRSEFPKLPADLERRPDRRELLALNDVILRACEPRAERRYRDAGEMKADLLRLQAGRRVRGVGRKRGIAALATALGVGLGAVIWREWPRAAAVSPATPAVAQAPIATQTDERSIAVLPFENRSDDKANSYLADGIFEDVVTNFASVRGLKVASLNSALRYRGTPKTLRTIGEELGVAYILTGSLRREGNRIRLNAQLVETRTDRQIWAKNYDRELGSLFAIQSDLAGEIVPALRLVLGPDEAKSIIQASTASGTAYDLYLRARALTDYGFYGTKEKMDQAESLLRQAVTEDPGFLRAWVELAKVYTDRYQHATDERTAVLIASAEGAVARARKLAPDAPEVRLAAGRIRHYCYEDYDGALFIYRDILASHPNYPDVRVPLAFLHRRLGRWPEAIVELREARRQEPGNRAVIGALLYTLDWVRRFDEMDALYASRPAEWDQSPEVLFNRALHEFRTSGSEKRFQDWLASQTPEQRTSAATELRRLQWAAMTGDQATVMELLPRHGLSTERMVLAIVPIMAGQREFALRLLAPLKPKLEQLRTTAPLIGGTWRWWAMFHALHGDRTATLDAVSRARQLFPEASDALNGPVQSEQLAMALAWIGETDEAIREVARLANVPAGVQVWKLKHNVAWLPLRSDPRLQAIIDDPAHKLPLVSDEALAAIPKP